MPTSRLKKLKGFDPHHNYPDCLFFEIGEFPEQENKENSINLCLTINFNEQDIFLQKKSEEVNQPIILSIQGGVLKFNIENGYIPLHDREITTSEESYTFDNSKTEIWLDSKGNNENIKWSFFSYNKKNEATRPKSLYGCWVQKKWAKLNIKEQDKPCLIIANFTVKADELELVLPQTNFDDNRVNNFNFIKLAVLRQLFSSCQNELGGYDLSKVEYKYE
ncbi:MAG: hypothetical protein AAGE84_11255 [Cyanobacteria bacterium P01_G01_bin.39]